MKRRKLKKKPIIMLIGIIVLFIFLIVLITSCNKEEEIKKEEKEITFISNFNNKSEVAIDDSVKKKIIDFMDLYYLSMKELKEYNMMHLFSSNASKQAYLTQTAMNYLINYRLAQRNDLSLSDCKYDLEIQKVVREDNKLIITVIESSSVSFSFMKDVNSDSFGIVNTFTFLKENDNYELIAFDKNADFYNVFTSNYEIQDDKESSEIKDDLLELNASALSLVSDAIKFEKEYLDDYNDKIGLKIKSCDHTYNREFAYNYAMLWVDERNSKYAAFDTYGGNCQNYASQVLSNGGIPMDTTGSYKWKWYGSYVDETSSEKGRTPSWTGVDQFYTYAKYNNGPGLCASVDGNYFYAEKGDVMQVGTNGEWAHTIVVVGKIEEDGELLDILTTSNTTDRKNYPLSAYNYSGKRMIKIYGWNEE